jgi:serine/threonine-protein kinase
VLKVGQRLGKYRLKRRIGRGGFADVFEAYDTLEKVRVALKIPAAPNPNDETLADFQREIQISAQLDHPNILSVKNADFIDGTLVIAYPLGERNLDDRLHYRLTLPKALEYAHQLLKALAHAHAHKVIHCDIKPENLILFPEGALRLADFGLAKQSLRTMYASSSGTLGYIAPEQAMGRPSGRSDVFSAGLLIYRMVTGWLPEWPYEWPPPGYDRLRRRATLLIPFLRKAMDPNARKRFKDAQQMLEAFEEVKDRALERHEIRRRRERREKKRRRKRRR